MIVESEDFVPPEECPVFKPSPDEFADPLGYVAKIRPIAEKSGICKIRPPAGWQPPFAVEVDSFHFTPRMQRLNELEAQTRVKLNFLDQIAKFWELQGSSLKIPVVERHTLDLCVLSKVVAEEGGFDILCRERKWSRVASRMGYPAHRNVGSLLRTHYERILHPYELFHSGVSLATLQNLAKQKGSRNAAADKDDVTEKDKEYTSHRLPQRQSVHPSKTSCYGRRAKRLSAEPEATEEDIVSNPELRKLQIFGAGPKMVGLGLMVKDKSSLKKKRIKEPVKIELMDTIKSDGGREKDVSGNQHLTTPMGQLDSAGRTCLVCSLSDGEGKLLVCNTCKDCYHSGCLLSPFLDITKVSWYCPKCMAKECTKLQDAFGFEQATKEYTLQSFGEMADTFKADYFNQPVHLVPTEVVEREFWRLVSTIEEDVTVEYGADIHSREFGSGFPVSSSKHSLSQEEEEYALSGWNLNNIPVLEQSVLGFINADISGMKVPWLYVGMCFSAFCWHIEDHWSYSINYLHWGEPKTWYGVPSRSAEHLEEVMKKLTPELFEAQPDLLHQLVTIMNPNILMSHGVPVVRTNQCAGEFVVTFPRAYHSGFNQGYNFAEAVNFCTADWLPMGRLCVEHYRRLHRFCVFSHEELICKMASGPDKLDLNLAAAVHRELFVMVQEERRLRKALLEQGTTEAEREAFELLPDDERQCGTCKTTCFLSALACTRCPNHLVCLHHAVQLCKCPPQDHYLRYRYTLDELPAMLQKLKERAGSFDGWASRARVTVQAVGEQRKDLWYLRSLLKEAEELKFPDNDLSLEIQMLVTEAERCQVMAQHLLSRKPKIKTAPKSLPKLKAKELKEFVNEIRKLPCSLPEGQQIEELQSRVEVFCNQAHEALAQPTPDSATILALLDMVPGLGSGLALSDVSRLRQGLQQARWLDEVKQNLVQTNRVTVDTMSSLMEAGQRLQPHPAVRKAMAELQELLAIAERWEDKASLCLNAKPPLPVTTLQAIVNEADRVPAHLPKVLALKQALLDAQDWIGLVETMQSGDHFPYLSVLERLLVQGRQIPVRLDVLAPLEAQATAARAWRSRALRAFLRRCSSHTLHEVLTPRMDIGIYAMGCTQDKLVTNEPTNEACSTEVLQELLREARDPTTIAQEYKTASQREVDSMRDLRRTNAAKLVEKDPTVEPQVPTSSPVASTAPPHFCLCRRAASGTLLACELCAELFHMGTCVAPPFGCSRVSAEPMGPGWHARDLRFLCPGCRRSRRPRLEAILPLLVALQKLPVRLEEGEALQCATERAMDWKERARALLARPEVACALGGSAAKLHDVATLANVCPTLEEGEVQSDGESDFKDSSFVLQSRISTPSGPSGELGEKEMLENLEEVLLEGDLLEVTLNETEQLWRMLRSLQPAPCQVIYFNQPGSTSAAKAKTRDRQQQYKRKPHSGQDDVEECGDGEEGVKKIKEEPENENYGNSVEPATGRAGDDKKGLET
uniref:lysine-specific demethylase 5C-like n=1 Tax=Myxine glutinosa TaxID=7769 RepID=UPI00358FC46D